jgi:hypothetical protein
MTQRTTPALQAHLYTRLILLAVASSSLAVVLGVGCGGGGSTTSLSGAGGNAGGGLSTGSVGTAPNGSGTASNGSATGGASSSVGGASASGTGTASTGTLSSTSGGGPCVVTACQGHVYECGDCLDNDGDGLVDADDPDCLGPCDNTESSYFGGIPGQNNAPCKMDCYFDQDTGSGNDDCYWDHKCDPHEVPPGNDPEVGCGYDLNSNTPGTSKTCTELYNAQSATCTSYCGPLTPNGCDCFGCCELPAGGGNYVWLGSMDSMGNGTCDLGHVSDPTKCHPCEPVKGCLNDCGTCELCIGKTTLPPECFPDAGTGSSSAGSSSGSATSSSGSATSSSGSATSSSGGGGGQCSAGIQPCGLPGESACPAGSYCITGCCQQIPQ